MITAKQRKDHERWLLQLTAIPTAAGREDRVIAWVNDWVMARRNLALNHDKAGNVFITKKSRGGRSRSPPVFITAHLDHPAFVVIGIASDGTIELEFRGGVNDPYFARAPIEIIDEHDRSHRATIIALDADAKPFKRAIARLDDPTGLAPAPTRGGRAAIPSRSPAWAPGLNIAVGDIARWIFPDEKRTLPRIENGLLRTHACDDLAAVAAALAALDLLRTRSAMDHVGVILTRAEEIGFVGAIAACKLKSIPKNARLICLENSRSFAESPIGEGPIVRVGDKMSVFEPTLTNRISMLMTEHAKANPKFKWQRKLMPGGTCEATAFNSFGYQSTCLCLALGNYHNMTEIDEVNAGKRPAKVGPEFIAIDDYHGLIEMLVLCATQLDSAKLPSLRQRMDGLLKTHEHLLFSPGGHAGPAPRGSGG